MALLLFHQQITWETVGVTVHNTWFTIYFTEKLKQRLNLTVQGHINELAKPSTFQVSYFLFQANTKAVSKFKGPYALQTLSRTFENIYLIQEMVCLLLQDKSIYPLSILVPIHTPPSFIYHNLFHSTDFAIDLSIFMSLPKTKFKP